MDQLQLTQTLRFEVCLTQAPIQDLPCLKLTPTLTLTWSSHGAGVLPAVLPAGVQRHGGRQLGGRRAGHPGRSPLLFSEGALLLNCQAGHLAGMPFRLSSGQRHPHWASTSVKGAVHMLCTS